MGRTVRVAAAQMAPVFLDRDATIDAAIRHYAFEAQAFVVNSTVILTEEIIRALGGGGSAGRLRPGYARPDVARLLPRRAPQAPIGIS